MAAPGGSAAPQQPPVPTGSGPAVPPPPPAEKLRVHGSYVWLGSLRAVGLVLMVLVVTSFSSLASLVEAAAYGARGLAAMAVVLGGGALVVVALFGVVLLVHYLSYRHLWYELGPYEFSLCSGILSKKRVHVAYPRVQSVDQRASLLQRIFGVCNVTIDTAGGASNKAILVPYLTKQQADTLRGELFARKQSALRVQAAGQAAERAAATEGPRAEASAGGPSPADAAGSTPGNVLSVGEAAWDALGPGVFGGEAVEVGAVAYEYGLTNKELILTGLSNNTAFVVAVLAVLGFLAQAVSFILDLFPGSGDVLDGAVGSVGSMMATDAAGALMAVAIGGIVVAALVLWALSVAGACISYGGFHARRRGDRIEVERGLLQHQIQGVSLARVQSVVIKQSLIRRLLGYCEVSLGKIDAGSADEGQQSQNGLADQGLIIHPFVKVDRVPAILEGLVPEFADMPEATVRPAPVALRRGLVRRCLWQGSGFWLAVSVAIAQAALNLLLADMPQRGLPADMGLLSMANAIAIVLYLLAVVLLAIDAVGAVLWFRGSGLGVSQRFMRVTNEGLSTETVSFPRQKIQFGFTKANPLQRAAGTATVNARTAAGVGGTTVRLIDVPLAEADDWLAWLEPRRP